MNKPKSYIHKDHVGGYSVIRVGKVAFPSIILITGAVLLYVILLLGCATWDVGFGGQGAGVYLFASVTGILVAVGVVITLLAGIAKAVDITRRVNR